MQQYHVSLLTVIRVVPDELPYTNDEGRRDTYGTGSYKCQSQLMKHVLRVGHQVGGIIANPVDALHARIRSECLPIAL
jgi:hypothetical protein